MSQTETNIGKLKPVELLPNETSEDAAKRILKGVKKNYHDTFLDQLLDDGYKEYIVYNDVLYKAYNRRLDDDNIFEAFKDDDGTINYVLTYYNGGCSFTEAMEYALDKIKLP